MKMMTVSKAINVFSVLLLGFAAHAAAADGTSTITFAKPPMRWLWGGFGFHNAEASMTALMTDEFRDERALKTFLEIEPSYSRVFAGFADWSKEAMDHFADYYDRTFRLADTVLYVVPCCMPPILEGFDADEYAEQVAVRLEYLVKTRRCTRLAFYCPTNELFTGVDFAWFANENRMALFKTICRALYKAFRRHELDIALMTPDASGEGAIKEVVWAVDNLRDISEEFCWHLYDYGHRADDLGNYARWTALFSNVIDIAHRAVRRVSLGEFGLAGPREWRASGTMHDDRGYSAGFPQTEHLSALARAEMGLAAMNAGMSSAVSWTMADYPDPFFGESGDSPRNKAAHEAYGRAAIWMNMNYNKWGTFRWDDENHDYSAYADLYTMGYLVKLFRRGSRVLPWKSADKTLRGGGVTNPDGSCSLAILNWGERKELDIRVEHRPDKQFRRYVYDSAEVPRNDFNDLQAETPERVRLGEDGVARITVPARSLVFLTTDYVDRTPSPVGGLKVKGGCLSWKGCGDAEHRYYRVFCNGRQVASTVATAWTIRGDLSQDAASYQVVSVDRWGNARKH